MRNSESTPAESLEIDRADLAAAGESHASKGTAAAVIQIDKTIEEACEFDLSGTMGNEVDCSELHRRGNSPVGLADSTLSMVDKKEGIDASLLGPSDDEQEGGGRKRRRTAMRNDAAFWMLGLINNANYVIMMAVAKEIAPGAVGVVFLADVAPTMLIKISAPYW